MGRQALISFHNPAIPSDHDDQWGDGGVGRAATTAHLDELAAPDGGHRRSGNVASHDGWWALTGLYLFAAAAGVPVVAWFLLSGGDGGDADGGDGIGGIMLRLLPLSTITIAVATFGVAGLALGAVGVGSATTLMASLVAAMIVGALNSTVFAYLRRSESTASVEDRQLVGAIGRVVLPITGEHRGRVVVSVGGQQLYLSARTVPGESSTELEVGAPVLVIEVSGGVAGVTRLDTQLA